MDIEFKTFESENEMINSILDQKGKKREKNQDHQSKKKKTTTTTTTALATRKKKKKRQTECSKMFLISTYPIFKHLFDNHNARLKTSKSVGKWVETLPGSRRRWKTTLLYNL